jgi:hypothetical protein
MPDPSVRAEPSADIPAAEQSRPSAVGPAMAVGVVVVVVVVWLNSLNRP